MFKKRLRSILVLLGITTSLVLTSCFGESATSDEYRAKNNTTKDLLQKGNFKLSSVDDLQQLFTYDNERYPLISAHRGGPSSGYPENAIESFQHIARNMPVIIECDIRLTKDSVLVLMHDETLDRTTTGHGKVSDYTIAELKKLYLKDNDGKKTTFKIPTMEEALIWGRGKVVFTLDVKEDVPYSILSNSIEKTNAKAYSIVITYNEKQARALYNINPDLVISASIASEADLRRHTEVGIPDNKLIAFVGVKLPSEDLVELLHQHGIKIILGTMGNLDKQAQNKGYQVYADYIERGADIISTDRPLEAKKALDFYIRKRKLSSPYINN